MVGSFDSREEYCIVSCIMLLPCLRVWWSRAHYLRRLRWLSFCFEDEGEVAGIELRRLRMGNCPGRELVKSRSTTIQRKANSTQVTAVHLNTTLDCRWDIQTGRAQITSCMQSIEEDKSLFGSNLNYQMRLIFGIKRSTVCIDDICY